MARAALVKALAAVAPGTPLREGLDRILKGTRGALIVIGDGPDVLGICSGGFLIDAPFSPQRLSEVAKMDGAIILTADVSRIARVNVHLVPSSKASTSETGTRHRTAEQVARSIGVPVVSLSEDQHSIALYYGEFKYPLESSLRLVNRANQALQTLERYKDRLDEVSGALSALEVEDMVTVRDVVTVLQRIEMVHRIAEEIRGYADELGTDGRLVRLQLEELMGGVEVDRRLVIQDYFHDEEHWHLGEAMHALANLRTDDVLDAKAVTSVLHLPHRATDMEAMLRPGGYRLLAKIPHLPNQVIENIVQRFGTLQQILGATVNDLRQVAGVGAARAQAIRDGLSRFVETSVLDRS